MTTQDQNLLLAINLGFIFGFYFMPGIIAGMRSHPQLGAIWVVNTLLGWTIIGWIAALVWAIIKPQERKPNDPAI